MCQVSNKAGQPISSAECLMHGAAHASHRAARRPAPPRPAVNVDAGAPSVVPSLPNATRLIYNKRLFLTMLDLYARQKTISALMVSCLLGKRSLPKLALFQMRPSLQKIPILETCFGKEARYTRLFSKKNYYRSESVLTCLYVRARDTRDWDIFLGTSS